MEKWENTYLRKYEGRHPETTCSTTTSRMFSPAFTSLSTFPCFGQTFSCGSSGHTVMYQSELLLKEPRPRCHGDGHCFHLLAYCLTKVTQVYMVSHDMFGENDCTRVCGLQRSCRIWIRVTSARALHGAEKRNKKCVIFLSPDPKMDQKPRLFFNTGFFFSI